MPRPRTQLSHETLQEEARFILRTLLRDDLFGERARLTEAERLIANSISTSFADYCSFLNKYGYVRIDQLANSIQVTDAGNLIVKNGDDPEFHARLNRHFARELGTSPALRPLVRDGKAGARVTQAPSRAKPRQPTEPGAPVEDVLDRRYRRDAEIGSGPVGAVFAGEHLAVGRRVAIKEARSVFQYVSYLRRDEIVARLRAAVTTQAKLSHPHIVSVIDQNVDREFPYFITEFAAGGDLRQRLDAAEDGKLPVSVAIRVLMQICYALRYAHAQGVLHLGIKPENVLFDEQGNVLLSDLGFSKISDRVEHSSQIPVLVGSGSVAYMPPERLQPAADQQELGPAADIYSLGILVYQMLTGKLPGRRSPLPSSARKGKEIPAGFDDVFDKMTRDELEDRYSSVDEVIAGIYKAFPTKEVFSAGTILLWADDPNPLPVPEAEAEDGPAETEGAEGGESAETDGDEAGASAEAEDTEASPDAGADVVEGDEAQGDEAEATSVPDAETKAEASPAEDASTPPAEGEPEAAAAPHDEQQTGEIEVSAEAGAKASEPPSPPRRRARRSRRSGPR